MQKNLIAAGRKALREEVKSDVMFSNRQKHLARNDSIAEQESYFSTFWCIVAATVFIVLIQKLSKFELS